MPAQILARGIIKDWQLENRDQELPVELEEITEEIIEHYRPMDPYKIRCVIDKLTTWREPAGKGPHMYRFAVAEYCDTWSRVKEAFPEQQDSFFIESLKATMQTAGSKWDSRFARRVHKRLVTLPYTVEEAQRHDDRHRPKARRSRGDVVRR